MVSPSIRRVGAALSIALLMSALALWHGCAREPDAELVAVTFLELYVFDVDQSKAMLLAEGLALDKLRKELEDVAAAREEGFAPDVSRPPIRRTLVSEEREDDTTALFTYRIEVRPKGGVPSAQNVLIHLTQRSDGWKVVDYRFWPVGAM